MSFLTGGMNQTCLNQVRSNTIKGYISSYVAASSPKGWLADFMGNEMNVPQQDDEGAVVSGVSVQKAEPPAPVEPATSNSGLLNLRKRAFGTHSRFRNTESGGRLSTSAGGLAF